MAIDEIHPVSDQPDYPSANVMGVGLATSAAEEQADYPTASAAVTANVSDTLMEADAAPLPQVVLDEHAKIAEIENTEQAIFYVSKWAKDLQGKLPMFKNGSKILDKESFILRISTFIDFCKNTLSMTPKMKKATRIAQIFQHVVSDTYRDKVPQELAARARLLLDKWNNENWGEDDEDDEMFAGEEVEAGGEEEEASDEQTTTAGSSAQAASAVAKARKRKSAKKAVTTTSLFPHPNHPIWGVNGIMHGTYMRNGRVFLNQQYPKRNFQNHGHNGLALGTWFPRQMVALRNGAHGATQGGISGKAGLGGAWSIVASHNKQYEELDTDEGDTLYFSGSNSHQNTDPTAPADSSRLTRLLHESLRTGKEVRVIRAASGTKDWKYPYPTVGMRYDGLYQVVDVQNKKNTLGGLYEQFKLVRLPGQESLNSIHLRSPTAREKNDFALVNDGY